MSTTFDIRRWATQAGIQTTGGFAVIAECVTMDELQRFAEIAIASAGGVQALSAAPNGWESVIDEARSGLQDSEPSAFDNSGYRAFAETVLDAVEEGLSALAASPTPPAEQQAAPEAAPVEQNTVPAEWLEQAYREGWAACRDAETIGEEAEDWAFGNSTANSRMIDAQQAAPQQEPVSPISIGWGRDYQDNGKPIDASAAPVPNLALAPQQEAQEPAAFRCLHEWDGLVRASMPPKYACKHCHNFFDAPPSSAPQPSPAPLSDDVVKDAARYQWLRKNWFTMTSNYQRCITFKVGEPRWSDITEEDLDAAIDAVIAAQGGIK